MPQRLDFTTLDLVEPTEALEFTFRSYVAEFAERKEKLIPFVLGYEDLDFGVMVRPLASQADWSLRATVNNHLILDEGHRNPTTPAT
jgi:hypothetical protein